jgi:hypothetical protein
MSSVTPTHTVLDEDVEALLDQERRIEDNQAKAERENIVTRPHLKEGTYRALCRMSS